MSLLTNQTSQTTPVSQPGRKRADRTTVAKLLLNAWCAEFALRLKPDATSREYLNSSLNWLFPQAYYALLFSVRAILAVDGIHLANPEIIENLLSRWARCGQYGPAYTHQGTPFADLLAHRISPAKDNHYSGPEAAAIRQNLINKIHAVGIIHETYILDRIGEEAYREIISSLPDHLKKGFVGARATLLLTDD